MKIKNARIIKKIDDPKNQQAQKIETFGDLKKSFEKMTKAAADLRSDEQRFEEAKKSFTKILDDEEGAWKKDFLTRDFKYSDTPINHDPPEGYVKITELDLAVGDYIASQRLRKDKSVLADPFVPDQLLSEFIKAYWSKHCDPQNDRQNKTAETASEDWSEDNQQVKERTHYVKTAYERSDK